MKLYQSLMPAALLLAASTSLSSAAETWDMPTAYPASNFQTVNAQDFSKCVATGTNGDISIVVHPNGSLFKGNDIKRAVQTGQTQMGERLLSAHENENALFGTDSIPFIATSYDDSVKLYHAAKPEMSKLLEEQGIKLVYSVPWPPQGLFFNKDVNSVADMGGVKVRSYNKATARLAELTGMVPISIEAAEISQAMAAGVINSLITSAVTGQDSKVWEQLTHFYVVQAWMPRNAVIINKTVWDGLSPDKQKVIDDCAVAAEAAGIEKSKAANDAAVAALKSNGMKVLDPSSKLAGELDDIGAKMAAEWVAKAGDPGAAVLKDFKK
ncbi:MAG: TRAP transporter substrate-binding protein [Rhizobiales bacterium]|nr:TRAP transporter substrate-binding protein [Hyphomicrobiales bacterium]